MKAGGRKMSGGGMERDAGKEREIKGVRKRERDE